jgi:hypothetical protein
MLEKGAGFSKDSLWRFLSSRCHDLEQKQRHMMSNRFVIASFDNLDTHFGYSLVGAGKERSGFHGTTIQTVMRTGRGPTLSTGLIKLSTIPGFSFLSRLKLLFALSEKEEHCNVLISMLDCPSVMSEMSVSLSVLLYVSAWLSGFSKDSLWRMLSPRFHVL